VKFGVFAVLLVTTGIVTAACSSTSSSKGSRGPDGGGSGGDAGSSGSSGGGSGGASGSGGAGGNGGAGERCVHVCDVLTGAGCSNAQPYDECVADCGPGAGECPAEITAFADCLATASIACDSDGDVTVSGCDSSLIRVSGCSACLPSSLNDACVECQQMSCCMQLKAVLGAADIFDFTDCVSNCATQACITGCQNTFPIAGRAFGPLTECSSASCAGPCSET
jgi:hypothetical protein